MVWGARTLEPPSQHGHVPRREEQFLPQKTEGSLAIGPKNRERTQIVVKESEARLRRREREDLGYEEPVAAKACTHCGVWKDRSEFPPNHIISDGLSSWCRSCHRAGTRDWKARHPDHRKKEAGR